MSKEKDAYFQEIESADLRGLVDLLLECYTETLNDRANELFEWVPVKLVEERRVEYTREIALYRERFAALIGERETR